ncbi:MAG: amidohydrolase family protein [Chloroflexota bacterium]
MPVIDADAHVIETEATWAYMTGADKKFRPSMVTQEVEGGEPRTFWMVDGRLFTSRVQVQTGGLDQGDHIPTPDDARLLSNVGSRLRHMDELGTDTQVLYPTIFILPVTRRADVELALARSYNRWMADVFSQSNGRLPWTVVPSVLNMTESLEELRFGKEHGACGVFLRGLESGNKMLSDAALFPLYEEAQRLDLSICVHTGNASFELMDLYPEEPGFSRFKLVGIGAFHHVLFNQIPKRFPSLRFGFIELSAQWLPYAIADLNRRFERLDRGVVDGVLKDNRIWVTCQTNDDLPVITSYVGDDNLLIGTDYGHADTSTEIYALQTFRNQGSISAESRRKILDDNARAFYHV